MPLTSATVRRHPVGVQPAGDPAHVRQPLHAPERAAAEVQAVELDLGRGVGAAPAADQGAQHGATCRVCGPPAMPTWPAPPEGRPSSRSRRCSKGRSTIPTGDDQPCRGSPSPRGQAALRGGLSGGSSSSRVGGSSSGGSQTWCAAGPWPTSRCHDHVEHGVHAALVRRAGSGSTAGRRRCRGTGTSAAGDGATGCGAGAVRWSRGCRRAR